MEKLSKNCFGKNWELLWQNLSTAQAETEHFFGRNLALLWQNLSTTQAETEATETSKNYVKSINRANQRPAL